MNEGVANDSPFKISGGSCLFNLNLGRRLR